MTEEDILKQLYIDLCDASINKNIDKLNQILSDDYILIHMTGMKQTNEDYINSVINGQLKYYDSKHENIEVIINNNKAYIIGKTKTLASPFGASKSWWNLKQEIVAEKKDTNWQFVESKASMY